MKIIRKLSLLLALCLLLTGCGQGDRPETVADPHIPETQASFPDKATQAPKQDAPEVIAAYGNVVALEDRTFYWRYTAESFEPTTACGDRQFSYRAETNNDLICRGADGGEIVIFTGPGAGELALSGGELYFSTADDGDSRKVYSCNYAGGDLQEHGNGALVYADADTVLVQLADGMDTIRNGNRMPLAKGNFLTVLDGNIYYETGDGQAPCILWSVDPAGTVTELYQAGIGHTVRKLMCRDGRIYFSCGASDDSGKGFQGGQILSVNPDGTGLQVMAAVLYPGFTLDEAGSILQDGPTDRTPFDSDSGRRFSSGRDAVYCMDRATGNASRVFTAFDLYQMEIGNFGIHGGDAVVNAWAEQIGSRAYGLFVSSRTLNETGMNPERNLKKAVMAEKDLETGKCRVIFDTSVQPPMCIQSDPLPSDALVSDAFTCVTAKSSTGAFTFHLPKINLDTPAAKKLNQEILDQFLSDAKQSIRVLNTTHSVFGSELTGNENARSKRMHYIWSVKDGILSLQVISDARPADAPQPVIFTCTVDSKTAEPVSNEQLMETFGITMDDVRRAISMDYLNEVSEPLMASRQEQVLDCFRQTVDMRNQPKLKLYLNEDGNLCCIYTRFWFSGVPQTLNSANLTHYQDNPHYDDFMSR